MTWNLRDQHKVDPSAERDATAYVSGPMRGYEQYNFPAFAAAERYLVKSGWKVYSPARMDTELDGFDGTGEWNGTLGESLRRDFSVICRSGSMFLLKGWQKSTGANSELKVADILKLNVYEFEYDEFDEITGFHPLEVTEPVNIKALAEEDSAFLEELKIVQKVNAGELTRREARVKLPGLLDAAVEEHRVVSETGGEKGSKLPRFDLMPPDALFEVAKVYGIGSKKYADRNWERGYPWGLSYAALERHLNKDKAGETYDDEGFMHLAAVAWHALALISFRLRGVGTDDRGNTAWQGVETKGVQS
jgi:hypothetical protein